MIEFPALFRSTVSFMGIEDICSYHDLNENAIILHHDASSC
jgi:hypothetical protein